MPGRKPGRFPGDGDTLGSMRPSDLLREILADRLPPEAKAWLDSACRGLSADPAPMAFFAAFAAAGRRAGKAALMPDPSASAAAAGAVPGWDLSGWSVADAARGLLLIALPPGRPGALLMDQLYETADAGEAVALLRALPLLPDPELHLSRAREGARSNAKTQFEAVALRNPYPALHFDEDAWNQLVAKALFVASPLDRIVGLDARGNPALARILVDHVAERTAAGRPHDPALWRCVDPHAKDAGIEGRAESLRPASPTEAPRASQTE